MANQVLYVRRRNDSAPSCALYIEFTARGRVRKVTANVPKRTRAPWIRIQKKEYDRLADEYGLKRSIGRPVLSEKERKQHRKRSGEQYRNRIKQLREEIGRPMVTIPLGRSAPDHDVERVLELIHTSNPATQRPYSGIEIALMVGRSPSFVSRVKNAKRRSRSGRSTYVSP